MSETEKGRFQKRTAALALLGVVLAVVLQLGAAWYAAGRGCGSGEPGEPLSPSYVQGYELSDGRWTVTGEVPMVLFQTEQDIGHIRISLGEPLSQDTVVVLYYVKDADSQFDRFCRTERYMMKGTRQAALTVPPGAWRSFRLEIRGDFVPEAVTLVPAADGGVTAGAVLGQVNLVWTAVLGGLFACGLCSWLGRGKAGRGQISGRMVWLDLVRCLAAALVIVVHVVEPLMLTLPAGSRLMRLTQAVSIGALTCNLLFVMISGALLLPYREEPLGVFVKKRVLSVVLPLAVYALYYIRLTCITQASPATWIGYYVRTLISGSIPEAPHLWLVYELLALYLAVIPFRYLLRDMPERLEKALALMILVLLAVRTASLYAGQPVGISSFLGDWPGIFLLGYFLTRDWMRRYDGALIAGGVAAFGMALWLAGFQADYKQLVCNQSILMTFMAMAVFAAVRRMERWIRPLGRVLSVCSGYSYSVLLIHWFVLNHVIYSGWMNSQMSVLAQLVCPVSVCLAVSLVLSAATDRLVVEAVNMVLLLPGRFRDRKPC